MDDDIGLDQSTRRPEVHSNSASSSCAACASFATLWKRTAFLRDLIQSVKDCMAIMTEKAVRHLPVMEQGKVVGKISIGDLAKDIISDQTFVIDQLVHFIHGA